MKIYIKLAVFFLFLLTSLAHAQSMRSYSKVIFSNDKINAWHIVVYPGSTLKMHPHPYDYAIIPIDNGELKLTTNTNKVSHLHLEKGKVISMPKLANHEMHMVENVTDHPVKMILIDLKKD